MNTKGGWSVCFGSIALQGTSWNGNPFQRLGLCQPAFDSLNALNDYIDSYAKCMVIELSFPPSKLCVDVWSIRQNRMTWLKQTSGEDRLRLWFVRSNISFQEIWYSTLNNNLMRCFHGEAEKKESKKRTNLLVSRLNLTGFQRKQWQLIRCSRVSNDFGNFLDFNKQIFNGFFGV